MPRRVVTVEDVAAARDGELRLPVDVIVTDRAREFAAERGVKLLLKGDGDDTGNESSKQRRADGESSQTREGPDRGRSPGAVALASDHAGYELKEYLKRFLSDLGYTVEDLGTHSTESVDYPDFARAVAEAVTAGKAWRGIVVDGAGIGSAMAANKVPGARAALCYDRATARNSREHNDANILTLGARLISPEEAREIAVVWLETKFAGGRHQQRVDKITALEHTEAAAGISAGLVRDSSSPAALSGPAMREELIEAVIREVLCRLGDQQACALRGLEIDDLVCPGCDGLCAESCPQKSRRVVEAGAARLGAGLGATRIPSDLARLIDHTLLKPEASEADVRKLCAEARQYGFATVCVNPTWVSLCAAELQGTPVKVCTVAGFPLGATLASVKIFEAEQAVKLGATEVDMVINVGALKSGHYERVEQEIRGLAEACHRGGTLLKVIIEAALLTDQEKVIASRLAKSAGADFVKTSTGFGPGGATAHDVELMRLVVGPEMGVKAAGGIRSYEDFQKMLAAGATRIGASASVKILREAAGEVPRQAPQAGEELKVESRKPGSLGF
jgi:deoxyribose-phosphate aldolase